MFQHLTSYRTQYLLPYKREPNAREDLKSPGFFHHESVVVAENLPELLGTLRKIGAVPVRVTPIRRRLRIFSGLSKEYKKQFLTAIQFNCSSMSAAKALEAVIESDSSSVREKLNPALSIIKRGGDFSEAVASINAYDESTLAILEAGERTGTLKESIQTAIEHLDAKSENSKLMTGIVSLTAFEVFSAFSAILGNRYGLLPFISESIPENATPQKIDEIKRAVWFATVSCDIMMWGSILVFFVATMATYAYFDKDKAFRSWVDKKVMSVPFLGTAILHTAVESSLKVASSLIKGGVHMPIAMDISEKSTRVPSVIDFWVEAKTRGESGDSVARTLNQPLLDSSDQLLIEAHADRAQLAYSFTLIAKRRNLLAKASARNFGFLSFFATVAYTTLAVLGSLYVLWIQNESIISGIKG